PKIEDLRTTGRFIDALKNATLEKSGMEQEDIDRLRRAEPNSDTLIYDKHFQKSLKVFNVLDRLSREAFDEIRQIFLEVYPDDPFYSHFQIKHRLKAISGIVPIWNDMCQDTCAAFTGPWSDLDQCPICFKPRYHPGTRSPIRRFVTIPLGPWIQSLYSSHETARLMHYREKQTEGIIQQLQDNGGKLAIYDDTICGSEYIKAVLRGQINKDDILLHHSHDGAQLYRDKESDCYFSLFII
ncbi:hypothetical protein K435DRAFT_617997, partial [Dendrothele bispora CBS 962.96]